jgi:hypothetical protein
MLNPAITAVLVKGAKQEEVEERIEARLKKAKATGKASAIDLDLDGRQQKLLDQAIASGTVMKTVDGRFYLNERAVSERKEGQGFMALLIVLVIGSVIASVAVLAAKAGG